MLCSKCKCCTSMWWSGFFGLAAIGHLLRFAAQVHVQLGSRTVPMRLSLAIAAAAGLLSFFLYKKGCGSCGCSSK